MAVYRPFNNTVLLQSALGEPLGYERMQQVATELSHPFYMATKLLWPNHDILLPSICRASRFFTPDQKNEFTMQRLCKIYRIALMPVYICNPSINGRNKPMDTDWPTGSLAERAGY